MVDYNIRKNVLAALSNEWSSENVKTLDLQEGLHWTPDAVKGDGNDVLYIQLESPLRRYAERRISAAKQAGLNVYIATPWTCILSKETLAFLALNDICVIALDDVGYTQEFTGDISDALVHSNIIVESRVRQIIAKHLWDRCKSADNTNEKGRSLELLMRFLLSQVPELEVVESNLRTETEELDIVVQNRDYNSGRCWADPSAHLILVESKNWTGKVGQPEVSVLLTKIRGKRRFVRIGVLVGANGFTSDARNQAAKFSSEAIVICFVGRSAIENWISANDYADYFENILRKDILS